MNEQNNALAKKDSRFANLRKAFSYVGKPLSLSQNSANDDMYAFLPAAIEVERRPASKAGNTIICMIILLFIFALAWALFGKVDIVAVAQGKVIPSEAVKQIQSIETARVKAIHVHEGDIVARGDVLIRLDDQSVRADLEVLKSERFNVEQNTQRLAYLSEHLSGLLLERKASPAPSIESAGPRIELTAQQQAQLAQERSEIQARLADFASESAQLESERIMTISEIEKKQRVLPVLGQRVAALNTLQLKSYGSKLQYLELQQELIEQQQDLKAQQARLAQIESKAAGVMTKQTMYLSEQQSRTLEELNGLDVTLETLNERVSKAVQHVKRFVLRSPIDGQVQQLLVTTLGGVVQSAEPLMQIVPSDSALEVDVKLRNKDIGFVNEGQRVAVKIDTFNFTKYGMLEGTLRSISDDAQQDKNLGLVYVARVDLTSDVLNIDGKAVRLSPGMAVTAEVQTGQRRLIEFFLSPLLRYQHESLVER